MFDWQPLILTFKLAGITTFILLILGVPLAYGLSRWRSRWSLISQTLISMPLVLPPTVLGFYLLLAFNPTGWLGKQLDQWFGLRLVFTFEGLVFASVIYSLPFMINPVQNAFSALPKALSEASFTLGKSHTTTFFKVLLPNIRSAILTGAVLCFAHTVGEFGVILMIGGSIPGETLVGSIAVYNEVELLNYGNAHRYALILFIISFCILLASYLFNKRNLRAF
ncbi:MAG: molybdate ABC transporter permease subunit [Calditrichota bacterium]